MTHRHLFQGAVPRQGFRLLPWRDSPCPRFAPRAAYTRLPAAGHMWWGCRAPDLQLERVGAVPGSYPVLKSGIRLGNRLEARDAGARRQRRSAPF